MTAAVWRAYQYSYYERYGTLPVRNAKVNAMMAALVKRLGAEEAPAVAAFYLHHQGALYVRSKHAVDLLLRDCEGLRTEWATHRIVTDREAREMDRMQATAQMWHELKDELCRGKWVA